MAILLKSTVQKKMNRRKKLSIFIVAVISLLGFVVIFAFLPLVIDSTGDTSLALKTNKGIVFIDRSKTEPPVEIYLVLSIDEYLNTYQYGTIVRYTSDPILIDKTLSMMKFDITHSDICTATSQIYIVSKGNVVFKSDISIEPNRVGIQSSKYGWCEAVDSDSLIALFSQFNIYKKPLLYLK